MSTEIEREPTGARAIVAAACVFFGTWLGIRSIGAVGSILAHLGGGWSVWDAVAVAFPPLLLVGAGLWLFLANRKQ